MEIIGALRPVILFIVSFTVSYLVTHGFVEPTQQQDLTAQLTDAAGYLLAFVTAILAIVHAFKHPNTSKKLPSTETVTTVKTEQTQTVFTPDVTPLVPENGGTPPVLAEQGI